MNENNDQPEEKIIDVDDDAEEVGSIAFEISSYGADYTVDSIVKRLREGNIFIPSFQRDYVWNQAEASRLVESLLLGLPVPGIFLARETDSNKLYVIDGQQRIKSLLFFFDGYFNPHPDKQTKKVFRLIKVQEKFSGKSYDELEDNEKRKLDDSIIHATIIKQDAPLNDNTSIYHVFERLNSGGRKLTPQEIRSAIYIGPLNDLLSKLNDNQSWRELYGQKSSRLKDKELILRFLALYFDYDNYQKPLKEFLNKFSAKYQKPATSFLEESTVIFNRTVDIIFKALGKLAFRPEKVFNAAACEVIMVGFARLLRSNREIDFDKAKQCALNMFADKEFREYVTRATSDESVINKRHELFEYYFIDL